MTVAANAFPPFCGGGKSKAETNFLVKLSISLRKILHTSIHFFLDLLSYTRTLQMLKSIPAEGLENRLERDTFRPITLAVVFWACEDFLS